MEMTGQSFQQIMAGSLAFGPKFISKLMTQCLEERKCIIWKDESETKGYDAMTYRLRKLQK